jgi:hypothetical protein
VLDNLVVQVPLKETNQTLPYISLCTLVPTVFAESNYISYLKLVCLQIAPVEHKDLGLHNGEGVVK